jgi:7,8-dihydro-6-hydroxymethylpterin-pyrophosphokinase
MVSDVLLALGSNMGDKKKNLTDLKDIYTDTKLS